jgi:hypothetical protein
MEELISEIVEGSALQIQRQIDTLAISLLIVPPASKWVLIFFPVETQRV